MPSSLIFAALAAAWLAVLVPMIAKRRQEVVHIAGSALASRVLHRKGFYRGAPEHDQEVPMTGDRIAQPDVGPEERQYRPGRGGYDPEAAELAAHTRYVFRQRVVFGLLGAAVLTLALGFASSLLWSVHAVLDTALIGYLAYLRRQVRIEEEVRDRRAARMAGSRGRAQVAYEEAESQRYEQAPPEQPGYDAPRYEQSREQPPEEEEPPARRAAPPRPAHPSAVAVDLDDDDPMFDELDPAFEPRYRRAAGE
ncbi:MAG: gephyrin-like molybdotransferase receptor GlpR [Pseudonocardiaceae bacterium]